MATYAGTDDYTANVYILETTDPVLGGIDGESNKAAKDLADRTTYLKARNDAMVGMVGAFALSSAPTGWLKANGARLDRADYQELFDKIGWYFGQAATTSAGISIFTSENRARTGAVAHGFATGDLVNIAEINPSGGTFVAKFGGVGPNIDENTDCYVRVLSATTFSLHPTALDATNNTNEAQVTTYSVGAYLVVEYPDKFTLPDLRANFVRGWDDSRGVDSGRLLGTDREFGATGTDYTNTALLYCIKYE